MHIPDAGICHIPEKCSSISFGTYIFKESVEIVLTMSSMIVEECFPNSGIQAITQFVWVQLSLHYIFCWVTEYFMLNIIIPLYSEDSCVLLYTSEHERFLLVIICPHFRLLIMDVWCEWFYVICSILRVHNDIHFYVANYSGCLILKVPVSVNVMACAQHLGITCIYWYIRYRKSGHASGILHACT